VPFQNLVDVKTAVCWDVTSFSLVYIDQRANFCLHLWGKRRSRGGKLVQDKGKRGKDQGQWNRQ
jgi:hypothetical protein